MTPNNNYYQYNQVQYPQQYTAPPQPTPEEQMALKHKLQSRFVRKRANGVGCYALVYLLTFTISFTMLYSLMLLALGSNILYIDPDGTPMLLLEIFIPVFSAFIPALLYCGLSRQSLSELIPAKRVKFGTLVPVIFAGLAVAMVANVAAGILSDNFSIFGIENQLDLENKSYSVLDNILNFFAVAVVPAFAEELAFRGVIMGGMRRFGDRVAIIGSSVLFASMHANIVQIPFAFILGLMFAYVDCKTNSILPSILIHFFNNAYALSFDLMDSNNVFGSNTEYISELIGFGVCILFCVAGFFAILKLAKKDKSFFKISSDDGCMYGDDCVLTLKDKCKCFFLNAGVIIFMGFVLLETIVNTIPT